jgi:hypothetical protein
MSKAERDARLAEGLTDLAELVERESECVAMLSELLDVARGANGDSDAFADRIRVCTATDAFRKLGSAYSSIGLTQYMDVNGDLAESVEKCLGLAGGLWLFMHGGDVTGEDATPTPWPIDTLGTEIARFGLANATDSSVKGNES